MVRFLTSLVTVGLLVVTTLVRAAPLPDLGLAPASSEIIERNVEMAVGRDGLDALEASGALDAREVINCDITYPTKTTKWTAGQKVKVTWNSACVDNKKFANYTGTLLLGYKDAKKPGNNLRVKHPLADDFLLRKGQVSFTLPTNITTRDSYIVVLMGDSDNRSSKFSIKSKSK